MVGPGRDGPYLGHDVEYNKHMQFVESLQWWGDAGLGDSNVWHFHPFGFIQHFRKCGWLSEDELRCMIPAQSCAHAIWATAHANRHGIDCCASARATQSTKECAKSLITKIFTQCDVPAAKPLLCTNDYRNGLLEDFSRIWARRSESWHPDDPVLRGVLRAWRDAANLGRCI